jgi:hypothetical protein
MFKGIQLVARNSMRPSVFAKCTTPRYTYAMVQPSMRMFSTDQSDSDFQPKSKLSGSDAVVEHITNTIENNDVVVFMKGTKKQPQCGFSQYVAVLMKTYGVTNFKDVNVLADATLRD